MTLHEAKHICRMEYVSGFFISLRQAYLDMKNTIGEAEAWNGYMRCISRLIDDFVSASVGGFISNTEFISLMGAVNDWKRSNDEYFNAKGGGDIKSLPKEKCEGREVFEFGHDYRVGYLLVPNNLEQLPLLTPRQLFIAPETIDLRDYCCQTRDQGRLPWCAAFAATGFASNVNWRKNDIPMQYDPAPIYTFAKTIDGCPDTDGTSLIAVFLALLKDGIFDQERCEIKVLRTIEQVKYAVHKFGCCIVGLNVSHEWYTCNRNKSTISGRKDSEQIGGHAVLVCGYNRDGVMIQNSWNTDWGSYGFALITWNEFAREFMYGAVIDNCLYDTKMN